MAKRSRTSRTRAGSAASTIAIADGRARAGIGASNDTEANIDGCDVEFDEKHSTPDIDLPEAKGGVEPLPRPRRRTARQATRGRTRPHRRRRAR